MKNFGIVSLILLFSGSCFAGSIEYNKVAEAWAKQIGLEVELANSGNYLYSKINKEYRMPLTVSSYIADMVIKGKIELNYKVEF